jgi:hypothetical protein
VKRYVPRQEEEGKMASDKLNPSITPLFPRAIPSPPLWGGSTYPPNGVLTNTTSHRSYVSRGFPYTGQPRSSGGDFDVDVTPGDIRSFLGSVTPSGGHTRGRQAIPTGAIPCVPPQGIFINFYQHKGFKIYPALRAITLSEGRRKQRESSYTTLQRRGEQEI